MRGTYLTLVIALIVAAALGWRGDVATVIAVAAGAPLAMVVLVRQALLRNAARTLRLETIADDDLPMDLVAARNHAVTLGFVPEPPLRMTSPTSLLAIPLLHRDKPIHLVLAVSQRKLGVRCTAVSMFPDLAGAVSTTAEASLAYMLAQPGSVRQVFAGASIEALVAHHTRAIEFVAEQSLHVAPIEPGKFEELEQWSTQRVFASWRARPTWHALVFVARKLIGWSPYSRPIAQQPGARRTIAQLVAGRVHAVPVARVV